MPFKIITLIVIKKEVFIGRRAWDQEILAKKSIKAMASTWGNSKLLKKDQSRPTRNINNYIWKRNSLKIKMIQEKILLNGYETERKVKNVEGDLGMVTTTIKNAYSKTYQNPQLIRNILILRYLFIQD